MAVDELVLERIEKLLSLSTSDNEHEAALAMQKARELLAKHNLELSDVTMTAKGPEPITNGNYTIMDDDRWVFYVAAVVAEHLGCKAVKYRGFKGVTFMCILGPSTSHQVVHKAVLALSEQINRMAKDAWKNLDDVSRLYSKRKSFLRAYKLGAAQRLERNLAKLRGVETDQTTAIILATTQRSNAAAHELFPRLSTMKDRQVMDEFARQRGYQDGQNLTVVTGQIERSK